MVVLPGLEVVGAGASLNTPELVDRTIFLKAAVDSPGIELVVGNLP